MSSRIEIAESDVPREVRRSTEPREYFALLKRDGVDVAVHRFWMPHWTKPGGRKAHFSLDMYIEREYCRYTAYKAAEYPPIWAHVEWIEECSVEIAPDLPSFSHATLWDMYVAIGYDIKKKRFTS
jgi:hypothetical protein